jgi:hypothetical protein
MKPDPIIDEIREMRHRISEECGHDPDRLVEYYRELEKKEYKDRLCKPATPQPTEHHE